MLRSLTLATLALVALPGTVQAQGSYYRGTPPEQQACTDDVFRLCGDMVPDERRIVACLSAKRASLSPACRAVFRNRRR
jgi:hypothetical protein